MEKTMCGLLFFWGETGRWIYIEPVEDLTITVAQVADNWEATTNVMPFVAGVEKTPEAAVGILLRAISWNLG